MNRTKKLKVCNVVLLVVTVVMSVSGIQLEITSGSSIAWVWCHIVLGTVFFIMIGLHLWLHYGRSNWLRMLWRRKSSNMRWLTIIMLVTLLTAIVATAGRIVSPVHSHIGALHGKLGFLAVALSVWHIARRVRFYR